MRIRTANRKRRQAISKEKKKKVSQKAFWESSATYKELLDEFMRLYGHFYRSNEPLTSDKYPGFVDACKFPSDVITIVEGNLPIYESKSNEFIERHNSFYQNAARYGYDPFPRYFNISTTGELHEEN